MPVALPVLDSDILKRFYPKIDKNGPNNCWVWRASKTQAGYGYFGIAGKIYLAHRISYFLFTNVDPIGRFVCHACDNPSCVNPDHLWLGDALANNLDKLHKGRGNTGDKNGSRTKPECRPRGERIAQSKLTPEKVLAIRTDYQEGMGTHRSLAVKYGVSYQVIGDIVTRKTWRHV